MWTLSLLQKTLILTPLCGRAMINIVMTFAQLERETIVERVTDNYYFRANNGYWAGGYAPYGYKIKHIIGSDGKKHSILEIDKGKSKIVKKIYNMYINQKISMRKIAQQLNNENIPTLKNGLWGINAVSAILSRPIYTPATAKIYEYFTNLGSNITNDIEYFDGSMTANLYGNAKKNTKVKALRNYNEMYLSLINCSPIISNEDWFKAQKIKGTTKHLPPRTNTSKISFLCGLVKCGKCGRNLVTQGCKNRYGTHYLICTNKRSFGASACNNKMIDVSKLEKLVLSDIKQYFNSDSIINKVNKYIKDNESKDIELLTKKEKLENDIVKLNLQIDKLINSIAESNEFTLKYINKKIEEIEIEKENKLKEISSLNLPNNNNDELLDYIKNINEKLNSNDFNELKILCKALIEKIVVTDKNIDIHYKI